MLGAGDDAAGDLEHPRRGHHVGDLAGQRHLLAGRERQAEVEEARGNWKRAAEMYRAVAKLHREADPQYGHEPAEYYLGKAKALEDKQRAAEDLNGNNTPRS